MRGKCGFTLIELLVIIVIIAVVTAIILPVFSKAQERAHRTSCVSNIKHLTSGMLMYAADWDETLPPMYDDQTNRIPPVSMGGAWDPGAPHYWPWQQVIYQNTGSVKIAICPEISICSNLEDMDRKDGDPSKYGPFEGHYGMNSDLSSRPLCSVAHPANTLLISDSIGETFSYMDVALAPGSDHGIPGAGSLHGYAAGDEISSEFRDDYMRGRHGGGVNVSFVDGHAKWMTARAMLPDSLVALHNGPSSQNVKIWISNPNMFQHY